MGAGGSQPGRICLPSVRTRPAGGSCLLPPSRCSRPREPLPPAGDPSPAARTPALSFPGPSLSAPAPRGEAGRFHGGGRGLADHSTEVRVRGRSLVGESTPPGTLVLNTAASEALPRHPSSLPASVPAPSVSCPLSSQGRLLNRKPHHVSPRSDQISPRKTQLGKIHVLFLPS